MHSRLMNKDGIGFVASKLKINGDITLKYPDQLHLKLQLVCTRDLKLQCERDKIASKLTCVNGPLYWPATRGCTEVCLSVSN